MIPGRYVYGAMSKIERRDKKGHVVRVILKDSATVAKETKMILFRRIAKIPEYLLGDDEIAITIVRTGVPMFILPDDAAQDDIALLERCGYRRICTHQLLPAKAQ